MRGISWLAANQLASQEGLCTMELVSKWGLKKLQQEDTKVSIKGVAYL